MFKSVHIVPKFNAETSPDVVMITNVIQKVASRRQLFEITDPTKCNEGTLIIAVGGDGTMLSAMRTAARYGSVAMGINLGRIGFLTDFANLKTLDQIDALIDDVFEYAGVIYPIEKRLMIRAWHGKSTTIAGNEVSISRDVSDAMITYRLLFDDVDAGIYRANSLLVSSPSGSTAYSLSAGGALMMPAVQALQVVPVAPLTMTARPIIIGPDTRVEIQAWGGKIATRADGLKWLESTDEDTKWGHQLNAEATKDKPFTMFVQRHGEAKILHDKDWNYFDMLTQKLGWVKE